MIDFYYWPTPNGWKISIMLHECGLPFRLVAINITAGDQSAPSFLAVSPNGRIPALVDHAPSDGGTPVAIFESGAILLYLAEKTARFLPKNARDRTRVLQWLMWQVGGLGPMLGQLGHFKLYASEKIPYAIERYRREARRLYAVLDGQLGLTGDCVAGEYSVADMACFPWVVTHKAQGIPLSEYPHLQRWFALMRARPGVKAGMQLLSESRPDPVSMDPHARAILFGVQGSDEGAADGAH